MRPRRIQLSRAKGWRKPEGAVVVSRPSRFGNPIAVGDTVEVQAEGYRREIQMQDRKIVVAAFRALLRHPDREFSFEADGPTIRYPTDDEIRETLAGRDLACWCPLDQPCHADVLLKIANKSRR